VNTSSIKSGRKQLKIKGPYRGLDRGPEGKFLQAKRRLEIGLHGDNGNPRRNAGGNTVSETSMERGLSRKQS